MCYLNSNLAKEIGRRTGWKEKVWGRRYQTIVISAEEEMQVARLRYVLSHGVKEGLVARVEEWPGVHCAIPLMTGAAVKGTWFDRTREQRPAAGKELEKGESASSEIVQLSPLPCWKHLAEEVYRARIGEIVREINEAAAAAREESQIPPLGADGVRPQNPETRPRKIKKSPAPFCHALRKKVRRALWEAYGAFFAAFREAAAQWRAGDRSPSKLWARRLPADRGDRRRLRPSQTAARAGSSRSGTPRASASSRQARPIPRCACAISQRS